jgi:hypothetical protein
MRHLPRSSLLAQNHLKRKHKHSTRGASITDAWADLRETRQPTSISGTPKRSRHLDRAEVVSAAWPFSFTDAVCYRTNHMAGAVNRHSSRRWLRDRIKRGRVESCNTTSWSDCPIGRDANRARENAIKLPREYSLPCPNDHRLRTRRKFRRRLKRYRWLLGKSRRQTQKDSCDATVRLNDMM